LRAVVIGSGFGGLAIAVRLLCKGYEVVVLEKRDRPGGRAYVYEQDGFVFDAGPTIITAPFLISELFELAGRRIEDYVRLFPVDPFYEIRFDDGAVFSYSGDPDRMRAEVARFSPEDVAGYERFLERSREIFAKGFVELGHVPFLDPWSMVRIVPTLVRLECYRSVLGLVTRYLRSEKLRQVFSFHPLLVGGDPRHAPAIYALICFLERHWGVHFAKGGMGAVIGALARLIEELGGEIRLDTAATRIHVEGGRARGVRTAAGDDLEADAVVSNGDVSWTYQKLVAPEHRPHNTDRKLARMRYSMSLFLVYFGTDRLYPDLAHHTILLGPRYEGLLEDVFRRGRLAPDMSLYLHAPTRSDPTLAPAGHEAFYVLSPVPNLAAPIDWEREKERYRDAVYARLESTCVPGLRDHLVTERLFTPLDFRDELWSHLGAAFSFEPLLTQSAYFRAHNRCPDIAGLYFVGAGTHPGAGLPGVLSSARATDSLIPNAAAAIRAAARPRTEAEEELLPGASFARHPREEPGGPARVAPLLADDLAVCRAVIREHSRSFSAASRLLPSAVRDAAVATYAFCRGADDDVDAAGSPAAARARHERTRERVARIYAGAEMTTPVARAFQWVVQRHGIPREEPDALLDGMEQDLGEVRVASAEALLLYCYRAAGVVGRMMSRIMGRDDPEALRRAVDLGIAMQLTNVARDVGEDARLGRVYLPATWLEAEGSHTDEVLAAAPTAGVLRANRRVLALAERYYESGIAGIGLLPARCRPAIYAAALVYREIGREVGRRGGDGVTARATLTSRRRASLLATAMVGCWTSAAIRSGRVGGHATELHAPLRRAGLQP
jgi:phytoene desaturase